jgi:hypothetical protein
LEGGVIKSLHSLRNYFGSLQLLLLSLLLSTSLLAIESTKSRKLATPVRKHSIIISDEGYYPKELVSFVGERIHLFVTTTGDRSSCLLMPDRKLFLSVERGKISEGEVFFDTPGSYKFYCPSGQIDGKIIVMPRNNSKGRKVASENIVNIWLPKDDE